MGNDLLRLWIQHPRTLRRRTQFPKSLNGEGSTHITFQLSPVESLLVWWAKALGSVGRRHTSENAMQKLMLAATVLWPRSVLVFSFACGLRPRTSVHHNTLLTTSFLEQKSARTGLSTPSKNLSKHTHLHNHVRGQRRMTPLRATVALCVREAKPHVFAYFGLACDRLKPYEQT